MVMPRNGIDPGGVGLGGNANGTGGTTIYNGTAVQGPPAPGTTAGSGGVAAAGTGQTGAGMSPLTGFAAQYNPSLANQAYENPWFILEDVFPGISGSDPGYQALRDFGGDPLTLFNIIKGSGQKIDQGAGDFINWLAGMYQNMGTVGGSTFDPNQLLNMLFGQTEFGAESKNTLGQILGAGDMSTQTRTLFNMLRDVSNTTMNPLAARGYQSAVAQAGDKYGNAMMKSDADKTMNPAEWIAQNMPHLAGR